MFSVRQKREIAEAVQKILRDTNHPELPDGEIQFSLHVEGAERWSWADILNNGRVKTPDAKAFMDTLSHIDSRYEALALALSALPDSETAGPDGDGYKFAWDELTPDEQEWVKGIRRQIAMMREVSDKLQWVVDNIYAIARREQRRSENGRPLRPEIWGHVKRLCETVGAQSRTVGVLRSEDVEVKDK